MEKIRKSRGKSGRKILSKLLSLLSVNSTFASLELDFSKIRNLTDIRILNFAKGWKSWEGINDRAIESDNVWITRFSELSCKKKSWKFLIRGRATFLFSFFTIYTRSLFVPAFMCRFCGFYFFPSFCHSLFPTAPCCGGYSTPRIPRTKPPVPLSYPLQDPYNSLHPHRVSGTSTYPTPLYFLPPLSHGLSSLDPRDGRAFVSN